MHIRFGSNFGPLTWTGQEWRLLTSAFLHFGIIHIALNMYALYQGGALVERLFGSARFAVIYLLSALSGSVASGWWDPLRNSAGASGAIFGVYGALLAFLAVRRADIPPSMLKSISSSALLFCLYSLVHRRRASAHRQRLPHRRVVSRFRHPASSWRGRSRRRRARCRSPAECWWRRSPSACRWRGWRSRCSPRTARIRRACASNATCEAFDRVEGELVRRQTDILTFPANVRVNRLEIAKRLRTEVLEPWRAASRPLLESATLPQDGSRPARRQDAIRDYLRAREYAIERQALALDSGDPADEALARAADVRLRDSLNRVNALARE